MCSSIIWYSYIMYIIPKKCNNSLQNFKSTGFQFPPLEMKHSCYGSNNRMIANSKKHPVPLSTTKKATPATPSTRGAVASPFQKLPARRPSGNKLGKNVSETPKPLIAVIAGYYSSPSGFLTLSNHFLNTSGLC